MSKPRFFLACTLWSFVIAVSGAVMFGWLSLDWTKGSILFLAFLSAISASSTPKKNTKGDS